MVRSLEMLTLLLPPRKLLNLLLQPISDQKHVDIVVVAFNNLELIEYQYQFVRKNIADNYTYIVADNSSDPHKRQQIESFCKKNDIAYISLPHNYLNLFGPSYSHGVCLNYICRKILAKRQPYAYAFVDHDLFPVQPYSIVEQLHNQPMFGVLRKMDRSWYLWAGMAFWLSSAFEPRKMDFLPSRNQQGTYLDTGGSNWNKHLHRFDFSNITFPNVEQQSIREGNDYHSDMVQYIDNQQWIHTINGSCWKPAGGG